MKSLSTKILMITLMAIQAKSMMHIEVMSQLGQGTHLNLHCESRDDDLGYHSLEDGESVHWSFNINFWGTTLFYCHVQWGDSIWYRFDAYTVPRDGDRCSNVCRWMISEEGLLFGWDWEIGYWKQFPLVPSDQNH